MKRVGIMGGTFDPIHLGHLIIASYAADELGLDEILFMPAQTPPHKRGLLVTESHHRAAMVQAAILPDPRFRFSNMDLVTGAPSFTSDLLHRFKASEPHAALFFIVGADSLRDFPTWHRPDLIIGTAALAVARRPGVVIDDAMVDALPRLRERITLFDAPLIDISSTAIRRRIAGGKAIAWLVPAEVEAYIRQHRLYIPATAPST